MLIDNKKNKEKIKKIPNKSGVYYFFNLEKEIIYIGKATNLKSRVNSYFSKDILEKRGVIIKKMVSEISDINFEVTENSVEALILEAHKIKKFQPKYNTKEKSGKSFVYLSITKEEFPKILIKREKDILENKINKIKILKNIGPFSSKKNLEKSLQIIRKIFPYFSNKKDYSSFSNIYKQIGLSPESIKSEKYKENIKNISLFFEGKKKNIIKKLEKKMLDFARNEEFEKAELYKKKIYFLKNISDFNINLKEDDLFYKEKTRIEAYDVAHLQGENHVGVMTIIENNEKKNSEYRKFKIKSFLGVDDNRALLEILERRFLNYNWELPDIVVADGGVAQKRTVEKFLRNKIKFLENSENKKEIKVKDALNKIKKILVVSCKKNKNHKVVSILGKKEIVGKNKKAILLANAEAHRFAIFYHRKKRDNEFLKF